MTIKTVWGFGFCGLAFVPLIHMCFKCRYAELQHSSNMSCIHVGLHTAYVCAHMHSRTCTAECTHIYRQVGHTPSFSLMSCLKSPMLLALAYAYQRMHATALSVHKAKSNTSTCQHAYVIRRYAVYRNSIPRLGGVP